jgi:hypothetical protein
MEPIIAVARSDVDAQRDGGIRGYGRRSVFLRRSKR